MPASPITPPAAPRRRRPLRPTAALASAVATAALLAAAPPSWANPEGGAVAGGTATITQSPGRTTIDQTSDRAVIDWDRFGIDGGEVTRFNQPRRESITLNRVTGDDVSRVLGRLEANGRVWLSNPNGVLFGPKAVVDVHGLVATTADVPTQDFLDGDGRFDFSVASARPDAAVVNEGSISIGEHGLAGLVAPHVRNDGVIAGRLGHVVLAGAPTFTLDFRGDGLIRFATTSEVAAALVPGLDDGDGALVRNDGTIRADGGTVVLLADAAAGVVDEVINTAGVVEARAFERGDGGRILLLGGEPGTVRVGGTLDASGRGSGQRGGVVAVIGDEVRFGDGTKLDVTGRDRDRDGTVVVAGKLASSAATELNRRVENARDVEIALAPRPRAGASGSPPPPPAASGTPEPSLQDVLGSLFGADAPDAETDAVAFRDDDNRTLAPVAGVVTLVAEVAGFADDTTSGIYDAADPENRVELFAGDAEPGDRATFYVLDAGERFPVLAVGSEPGHLTSAAFTSPRFGFFSDSRAGGPEGDVFFSDPALNPGGLAQARAFRLDGLTYGGEGAPLALRDTRQGAFARLLAWEDVRLDTGDRDHNDHVVNVGPDSFVAVGPPVCPSPCRPKDPTALTRPIDPFDGEGATDDPLATGGGGRGVSGTPPPQELPGDLLFSNDGNRELWELATGGTPPE